MKTTPGKFAFVPATCALLILSFFSSTLALGHARSPQDPTALAIRDIVAGRERIQGYVLDIKSQYKTTDEQYIEARKKYRKALGNYNGWVAAVKDAIRKGKIKNLPKDPTYKTIADDAGKSLKEFIDYVESETHTSKGIVLLVSAITDLGFKIWNGYKDRKAKEREREADNFEKDTKWKQWEDIKES